MIDFSYKAYLPSGSVESGIIQADDQTHAIRLLSRQSKQVFSISSKKSNHANEIRFRKTSSKNKIDTPRFFLDLSELVNAGLNVDLALQAMEKSETKKSQKRFYQTLTIEMTAGKSLSDSCKASDLIAVETYTLIKTGEQSGKLGYVLALISEDSKKQQERKKELIEAILYPCFLIVVMIAAVATIAGFLVPSLEPIFESSGKDLPFIMQMFSNLRHFTIEYGLILLIALGIFFSILILPTTHKWIGNLGNKILFKTPVLGQAIQKRILSRYTQSLALMLQNNVTLQKSLNLSANGCSNIMIRKKLMNIAEEVSSGRSLPATLQDTNLFGVEVISILTVGDQVNKLPDVLTRISEMLDAQSKRTIDRFVTFLTPAITIIMGILIGGLALSVMTALLSINELAL